MVGVREYNVIEKQGYRREASGYNTCYEIYKVRCQGFSRYYLSILSLARWHFRYLFLASSHRLSLFLLRKSQYGKRSDVPRKDFLKFLHSL